MKKVFYQSRGFSLIELLVIISIIGFLSTLITVMINSARIKTRDTNRLATLRLIYDQLSLLDADPICSVTSGGGVYLLSSCTGIVGGEIINFSKFIDPKAPPGIICHENLGQGPCAFSIGPKTGSSNPTLNNYQVCTWLEGDATGFPSGLTHIDDVGNIKPGCDLTMS